MALKTSINPLMLELFMPFWSVYVIWRAWNLAENVDQGEPTEGRDAHWKNERAVGASDISIFSSPGVCS